MTSKQLIFLIIIVFTLLMGYILNFDIVGIENKTVYFKIPIDKNEWGAFGDYIGGLLNPLIALFVFYYVIRNYEAQQNYFKSQEFENHFFNLFDNFKTQREEWKIKDTFNQFNKRINNENIVTVNLYRENIYNNNFYPHEYFDFFIYILNYINKHQNIEINNFIKIIKYNLSNEELLFIALHTIINNKETYYEIVRKFDILEYLKIVDIDDEPTLWIELIFREDENIIKMIKELRNNE